MAVEREPQVIPDAGVLGRRVERRAQRLHGLGIAASSAQRAAKREEHARVTRAKARGLAIRGRGVGQPARALEGRREPDVRARVSGRGVNGLAKRRGRIIEPSVVEQRAAERQCRAARCRRLAQRRHRLGRTSLPSQQACERLTRLRIVGTPREHHAHRDLRRVPFAQPLEGPGEVQPRARVIGA